LDRLKVPDEVCKGLDRLAAYEYRPPALDDEMAAGTAPKLIDVESLGHFFEQSISDLAVWLDRMDAKHTLGLAGSLEKQRVLARFFG
jgi:hypothetical protein